MGENTDKVLDKIRRLKLEGDMRIISRDSEFNNNILKLVVTEIKTHIKDIYKSDTHPTPAYEAFYVSPMLRIVCEPREQGIAINYVILKVDEDYIGLAFRDLLTEDAIEAVKASEEEAIEDELDPFFPNRPYIVIGVSSNDIRDKLNKSLYKNAEYQKHKKKVTKEFKKRDIILETIHDQPMFIKVFDIIMGNCKGDI